MTDSPEVHFLTLLSHGWVSQADWGRWYCTTSRQNPPALPQTAWWRDAPEETNSCDIKMSRSNCRMCSLTISCFRSALSAGFLIKLGTETQRDHVVLRSTATRWQSFLIVDELRLFFPTYHLFTKSWNSALNIAGSFGGGYEWNAKIAVEVMYSCLWNRRDDGNLLHWRCNQVVQILPWVVCCQNYMLIEEKNSVISRSFKVATTY